MPLNLIELVSQDTENINANCIESQYEYQGLVSIIHPPDYWRNLGLGSSKSRTKQTRRSRENNYSGFALELMK
jgi:hypothetical protein